MVASFVATVWWIGLRRPATWLALGILALPIAWCLAIGQAQVLLTLFTRSARRGRSRSLRTSSSSPASIALWWIGRRDWRSLGVFAATLAGLALLQLVLAPQASLDYLTAITLKQVGAVTNSRRTPSRRCCGARSSSPAWALSSGWHRLGGAGRPRSS